MNPTNSIVFVSGVHGCGKTTISRQVALILGAAHVTASELIYASQPGEQTVTRTDKREPTIDVNQEQLLRRVAHYRSNCESALILLDGHFVLLDSNGSVTRISVTVYESISPVALLMVETDASVVHKRLTKRDGAAPTLETILLLADEERSHAASVSAHLKIPLCTIRGDGELHETASIAVESLRVILDRHT